MMFQQYCSKDSISGRTVSLSAISQLKTSRGGGSCLINVSFWHCLGLGLSHADDWGTSRYRFYLPAESTGDVLVF